jgi:hypothetical protein
MVLFKAKSDQQKFNFHHGSSDNKKNEQFFGLENLSCSIGIKIKIYKKGKPVERRRRKTTGLKPKGYDRRVAECCTEDAPFG